MNIKALASRVFAAIRENGLNGIAAYIIHLAHGWSERRQYAQWRARHEVSDEEWAEQRAHTWAHAPLISVLTPVYNTPPALLRALCDSLLSQSYERWEACLYDGSNTPETRGVLEEYAARDTRFHVAWGKGNHGISGNTNMALQMAEGEYVALCDHDDLLTRDALFWMADAITRTDADMLYSDEDRTDKAGKRFFSPHFKPDFSPDNLRSGNYICHLLVLRRSLVLDLGGLRSACDGSQDHDLALRVSERANRIVHIPRILYHWRKLNTSMSYGGGERCLTASQLAVSEHLCRVGFRADVCVEPPRIRLRYQTPVNPSIAVVLYGDVKAVAQRKAELQHDSGVQWELMICEEPWNYAKLDALARKANSEWLLFLDARVKPRTDNWWRELLMYAQRADVGAVSGVLCNRKNKIANAGYALGLAGHAASRQEGMRFHQPHAYMTYHIVCDVSALSAAMLMITKRRYLQVGGFGDGYQHEWGDISLCRRLLCAGYLNVMTPFACGDFQGDAVARFSLHEGANQDRYLAEFPGTPAEPYYNPHYGKQRANFRVEQS